MRVRLTCPDCGNVVIDSSEMWVLIRKEDNAPSYGFICSECQLRHARPTTDKIANILIRNGVICEFWSNPTELDETKAGPPINYDDILDFLASFDEEAVWEELGTSS